jgi:hypothetical protein
MAAATGRDRGLRSREPTPEPRETGNQAEMVTEPDSEMAAEPDSEPD